MLKVKPGYLTYFQYVESITRSQFVFALHILVSGSRGGLGGSGGEVNQQGNLVVVPLDENSQAARAEGENSEDVVDSGQVPSVVLPRNGESRKENITKAGVWNKVRWSFLFLSSFFFLRLLVLFLLLCLFLLYIFNCFLFLFLC